jgi:hypothetical protein
MNIQLWSATGNSQRLLMMAVKARPQSDVSPHPDNLEQSVAYANKYMYVYASVIVLISCCTYRAVNMIQQQQQQQQQVHERKKMKFRR